MYRKARLLTAALGIGWSLVIAGGLPASAVAQVVAEGDGITVYEHVVEGADGGTGMLLIARLDPRRMRTSVVEGNEAPPVAVPWAVTINGSYFDEAGTPVYHLRQGSRVFAPFRKGTNAVFWCRDGRCAIQHSSDFVPNQPYDLAVQSAPRLLENGRPTKGVRGTDVVDGRAGLALAEDGAVLVFASAPLKWGGLAFDDVRRILTEDFQSESILMLDGGNSARLSIRTGKQTFTNGLFSRAVPYSIRFTAADR
jgi:hypothetical protein